MDGKYRVILADPPWAYRVYKAGAKTARPSVGYYKPSPVAVQYDTLAHADLCAVPVAEWAAKDAVLFMWATSPCLPEALAVMAAWGFAYKTVGFNWIKLNGDGKATRKGMGHYTRGTSEICLIGRRGSPQRRARDVQQVIQAPRREHSRKPDEQYGRIMRLFDGPYLELFARQRWPGWDVWGNQAGKFPAQPFLFPDDAA